MSSISKYISLFLLGGIFCLLPSQNLFGQYGVNFEAGIGGVGVGAGTNSGFGVQAGDSFYGIGNGYYNGYHSGYDFDHGPSVGYYNNYPTNSYFYYNTPGEVGPNYNGYYYEPFYFQY